MPTWQWPRNCLARLQALQRTAVCGAWSLAASNLGFSPSSATSCCAKLNKLLKLSVQFPPMKNRNNNKAHPSQLAVILAHVQFLPHLPTWDKSSYSLPGFSFLHWIKHMINSEVLPKYEGLHTTSENRAPVSASAKWDEAGNQLRM